MAGTRHKQSILDQACCLPPAQLRHEARWQALIASALQQGPNLCLLRFVPSPVPRLWGSDPGLALGLQAPRHVGGLQNHRNTEVGKDLQDHPVQPSTYQQ